MKISKQARFVINHDAKTKVLTVTCTKDIVVNVFKLLEQICRIELMGAERTVENTYNDEGDLFENCVVLKFKVEPDVVDILFEAGKRILSHSISESINHNQN